MDVFQRAKASVSVLRKAWMTKSLFVFACLLLCLMTVSLLGGAGTAYAASARSAATGGGCASNKYIRACTSESSEGYIVSDAYILSGSVCSVAISLLEDGHEVAIKSFGSQCFAAGTHLSGPSVGATAGHTWMTAVIGTIEVNGIQSVHVDSPSLHT